MKALSADSQITRTKLTLDGMDCTDCEVVLEHRLKRLDGILEVNADFNDQSLRITYDKKRINRKGIEKRIRQMGYDPMQGDFIRWFSANRELLFSLVSGVLLLCGWFVEHSSLLPEVVSKVFYLAAFLPAGYDVGRESLELIRARQFDIDILMFVAALGALILGEYPEGALLVFLFALGHALQGKALDRARRSVQSLADLTPRMALVRRSTGDQLIPLENLSLNDVVIVRPGDRIPVDGEVILGSSYVNEAPITGEPMPVEKTSGAQVFAGTLNTDGALEVRSSRLAKDSTISRIMQLVEQAQSTRSPTQLWVDRFSRIFVPVVLLITGLLMIYPILVGETFNKGFLRAVTFLVAASPCALALGTPSAMLAGIAQAARHGVLVKGGAFLEALGKLRAIAFDKTGTLTFGRPHITDILASPGWTETDALALAASIETRSNHPIAMAIIQRTNDLHIPVRSADRIENISGKGMRGYLDGQSVWVGSRSMMIENKITIPSDWQSQIQSLEKQGKTIVFAGAEEQAKALFAISDQIRPEARSALADLARIGVAHTIMLSGDNNRAAASIAGNLGLTDYRAELSPEDKLVAIDKLIQSYKYVGMVGDGINDAPALAKATVGIALGSARNDIALEAADIALMSSDLSRIPFAIGLGRAVYRVTVQNLVISLCSILLLTTLGLLGMINMGLTVFFHEGTTLIVVANALRLLMVPGSQNINASVKPAID